MHAKAARGTGGSAVGYLLLGNIPGRSHVGFVWLPFEVELG